MRAEVISIGDELTTGQRLDTNSRWLAAELGLLGIPVASHTTVPDTLEAGVEAFRLATGRSEVVVATGGLGPTADDLTRDVLSALTGKPLEIDHAALADVESRFARRGVAMPESNRRQAMFPRGSRVIPNDHGTAPGLDVDVPCGRRRSRVFALPGVPAEMKPMWEATVVPALLALVPGRATILHRRIKCFGAGESAIEAMLPDLVRRGRDPLVGITAHEATITLRITARGRDEGECLARIAPTEATIRSCLGPLVFGVDDDEVEDAALAAAATSDDTVASVEIATAGRVALLLAESDRRRPVPGRTYRGGRVGGAVGTAVDLATAARCEFGSSIGLGIGPPRPTAEGRQAVDIALATAAGCRRLEHVLAGGPFLALPRAAKTAIDLVRTVLREESSHA